MSGEGKREMKSGMVKVRFKANVLGRKDKER